MIDNTAEKLKNGILFQLLREKKKHKKELLNKLLSDG